jgi:hypothetical protein
MSKELQRSKIMELEGSMRCQEGYEEGDGLCEIFHHFAPGVYLREMRIPQGYLITGKIHKTEHYCIVSKGEVAVNDGIQEKIFKAPAIVHSKPGAKRAIYAIEDSVWTNIHPTTLTDPDEVEKEIIAETFEELDGYLEHLKDE